MDEGFYTSHFFAQIVCIPVKWEAGNGKTQNGQSNTDQHAKVCSLKQETGILLDKNEGIFAEDFPLIQVTTYVRGGI
jgi:hypothetical protein